MSDNLSESLSLPEELESAANSPVSAFNSVNPTVDAVLYHIPWDVEYLGGEYLAGDAGNDHPSPIEAQRNEVENEIREESSKPVKPHPVKTLVKTPVSVGIRGGATVGHDAAATVGHDAAATSDSVGWPSSIIRKPRSQTPRTARDVTPIVVPVSTVTTRVTTRAAAKKSAAPTEVSYPLQIRAALAKKQAAAKHGPTPLSTSRSSVQTGAKTKAGVLSPSSHSQRTAVPPRSSSSLAASTPLSSSRSCVQTGAKTKAVLSPSSHSQRTAMPPQSSSSLAPASTPTAMVLAKLKKSGLIKILTEAYDNHSDVRASVNKYATEELRKVHIHEVAVHATPEMIKQVVVVFGSVQYIEIQHGLNESRKGYIIYDHVESAIKAWKEGTKRMPGKLFKLSATGASDERD